LIEFITRVAYQEATESEQDDEAEFGQDDDDDEAWVFKPISLDQAYIKLNMNAGAREMLAVKVQQGSAQSAHQN